MRYLNFASLGGLVILGMMYASVSVLEALLE